MNEQIAQLARQFVHGLDDLPHYLSQHVLISVIALGIGILISMPLAIVATRRRAIRWPMLTIASVNQTIPSIALLVLIYALMLAIAGLLLEWTGWRVPAVSFISAVTALTLYSMLPVMRNTVTGILGVDPAMVEAARGVGMTPRQRLFMVELPLAAPVIIAGIRTATVWVVGIATLSTPVGQTSLGDYIFTGLQLQSWGSVLLGCVAAAVLAIVLDMLIALLQSAAEKRNRTRAWLGAAGLVVVLGGGLTPLFLLPQPDYLVGAKTFDEQYILSSLLRDQLREQGFDAGKRQSLGSTTAFQALSADRIDTYVDYTGTIWAVQMQRDEVADADTVYEQVKAWLKDEHGITTVGRLGFENAYALVMRRQRAEERGIESITDLASRAPQMVIGGDYEFFDRPEWDNLRQTYGLRFQEQRKFQSTLMYQAARSDEVDVIAAFSSDGRIAAYDLLVLDDPRNAIPPYDAILMVSPKASRVPGFVEALQPIVGRINDDLMRQANYMVDRDENKRTPDEAADWLAEQITLERREP